MKCSSYPLQLKAYYILLHPMQKVIFCTSWNTNWFKNLSSRIFLFSSIIITKFLSACQVALTACFRKWKISYTSFEFWWPTCNGPKSGHSNERIYRKPVDKRLKTLKRYSTRDRVASCDQQLLSYGSFSRTSSATFLIKRKHKYKILKGFFAKIKFPQSPKRTTNYSSKCNGYRSVINIVQNFGYVQNKNLNLYARQIYFTDIMTLPSFPDHENLLKEVVIRLALFLNAKKV